MNKSNLNDYNFWKQWKNKTSIEKKAITVVKKAREFVLNSIPQQELVAIYIKGSFVRREMNSSSDVDMVPIVTKNKYESAVFGVNDETINPVMVVPLSIEEFKKNTLSTTGNYSPELRAEPDIFLKKISHYKLIYGKPLNIKEFPCRSDRGILKSEIYKIKNGYIKAYEQKVIPFDPLLKEVFWLIEWEQKVKHQAKHKSSPHSFKEQVKSIKSKDHIIYDAYKLRISSKKDKKKEQEFITKLKIYLDKLGQEHKRLKRQTK